MKLKLMALLVLGIWLGMLLGISFLEAPLKFRAPNITLPLGLGIGKLVFSALNKVELFFSIFLLGWIASQYKSLVLTALTPILILAAVVMIQSFWLLPILNARVDQLLQGIEVTQSNHHLYYILGEVLKVLLLIYGFVKVYHHD